MVEAGGWYHVKRKEYRKELSMQKMKAHKQFDRLWKKKSKIKKISWEKARNQAYKWLCSKLKLRPAFAHIEFFDIRTCREVLRWCQQEKEDMKAKGEW